MLYFVTARAGQTQMICDFLVFAHLTRRHFTDAMGHRISIQPEGNRGGGGYMGWSETQHVKGWVSWSVDHRPIGECMG